MVIEKLRDVSLRSLRDIALQFKLVSCKVSSMLKKE
jgi:hypothetical protein